MSAVLLITVVQLRRRARHLALLAMLVALVSGAVAAAVVAADRASTSIERFIEWSRMSNAGFPANVGDPELMVETLSSLPEVDALAASATLSVFVPDDPAQPLAGESLTLIAPDANFAGSTIGVRGVDVDRPLILEGRLPRAGRADEILVFEWMAERTGWQVGDRLDALTLAQADMELIFDDSQPFPGMNGPALDLVIVGIGRSGQGIGGDIGENSASAYGSAQLFSETSDTALWWPSDIVIRTNNGANEFDLFPALEAAGVEPTEGVTFGGEFVGGITDSRATGVRTATESVDTMAFGLRIFAAGVAAAGVIVIAQAVGRHIEGTTTLRRRLFELGHSKRETVTAVVLPIGAAAVAGGALGSAAAILASRSLPTGLAGRAEVDPGIWVRPEITGPIIGSIVASTIGVAYVTATLRSDQAVDETVRATPSARVNRLHLPPPIATGIRLAVDGSRGARILPTRAAFTGLTIGVLGVVAAGLLTQNVRDVTETPSRWGWNWSTSPIHPGPDARSDVLRAAAEPGVDSAGLLAANGVSVNGTVTGGFTIEPLVGNIEFTVRSGRHPAGPGEVALGGRTLRRLGVEIGDPVEIADFFGDRARTVTVVGTTVLPFALTETVDDGVVMSAETLFDVTDAVTAQTHFVMRYEPGVDPSVLEADLAADHGFIFFEGPGEPPGQLQNLGVVNGVSVALAVFFVALGAAAVTHAISVSGQRRRVDLAVLRALGLDSREVRSVFLTQALVFGAIALTLGIPLGLATGRFAWRAVTDELGVVTTMTVPWLQLLIVVPACLVLSALLSWGPARAASRQHPTDALRTE